MKRFDNLKMVLFDSTNASFKLAVEAQFVRGNPQQGQRHLVYVTDRGCGMLNPNIYLTLAYKGDDNPNPVYTSYPQLFRIRSAFSKIKDLVADRKGFLEVNGSVTVRQEYAEPVVVANIGKGNNWISLKLIVIESGENGVVQTVPGVSIELSTANHAASVLSVDEFLTIYTIINDLDLSSIQCQMSLAYLAIDGGTAPTYGQAQPAYAQPAQPYYGAQPQNPPYMAAQPTYYNNTARQPRYNQGTGYTQRQARPAPQPGTGYTPASHQAAAPSPVPQSTPSLPPRSSRQSVMSLSAVEDTPIIETDYNDTSAIDAIFDD